MQLQGFECPNCGANEMEATKDGQLLCLFCGSTFGEVMRICPNCGHYNEGDGRHCSLCGAQIIRECPACGSDNWVLADFCVQCGRNLDLIQHMAERWQHSTEERLEEQRAGAAQLKAMEEQASQERMAAFLEAERIRQEALALARESRRERDRQVYLFVAVAIIVFVIFVVLTLLLAGRGG